MKKWFLISSIALGSLSLGANEPSSEEQSAWVMGPQWIQEIPFPRDFYILEFYRQQDRGQN